MLIILLNLSLIFFFFFFNDTATTEIYTLSLHDALPILRPCCWMSTAVTLVIGLIEMSFGAICRRDRKSTRLNSSHLVISYAVFCLKKKKDYTKFFTTYFHMRRLRLITTTHSIAAHVRSC